MAAPVNNNQVVLAQPRAISSVPLVCLGRAFEYLGPNDRRACAEACHLFNDAATGFTRVWAELNKSALFKRMIQHVSSLQDPKLPLGAKISALAAILNQAAGIAKRAPHNYYWNYGFIGNAPAEEINTACNLRAFGELSSKITEESLFYLAVKEGDIDFFETFSLAMMPSNAIDCAFIYAAAHSSESESMKQIFEALIPLASRDSLPHAAQSAIAANNEEALKSLVKKRQFRISDRADNSSPLVCATDHNSSAFIKILLTSGLKYNATFYPAAGMNFGGGGRLGLHAALICAVDRNFPDAAEALIQYGRPSKQILQHVLQRAIYAKRVVDENRFHDAVYKDHAIVTDIDRHAGDRLQMIHRLQQALHRLFPDEVDEKGNDLPLPGIALAEEVEHEVLLADAAAHQAIIAGPLPPLAPAAPENDAEGTKRYLLAAFLVWALAWVGQHFFGSAEQS